MTRARPTPSLALACLFGAGLALLAIGALKARQNFLSRGLPQGLPQPILEGGTRLGINADLAQYDDDELGETLAQIKATGFDYVKQPFYFSGDFDWEASGRIVAAVSDYDLLLVPLLDGDPARNFAPPADPAVFAAWAGQFAARYGGQVRHYIIWDEPNLASHWGHQPANPAQYAALLTAASQAIRAADSDAIIVAAPLAPTTETGPANLADPLFLQALYDAGAAEAFDVVAGKPYGFYTGPDDRRVEADVLNFSRTILLREVMVGRGDGHKAIWAGNWGWNSLPPGWTGPPSLWGQASEQQQAAWTLAAWQRARREWPWMGLMFLENWEPDVPADHPRWGFSVAGRETAAAVRATRAQGNEPIAYPGFHPAQENDPAQNYAGGWRFSPQFGADIGDSGDRVTFTFWGTDVGLRVRRADFRARLYVSVDGQPANALPRDENGAALVLTAADSSQDAITTELVARNLPPGPHRLTVVAERGWDQWALNGFSAAYHRPATAYRWSVAGLALTAVLLLLAAVYSGRRADWGGLGRSLAGAYRRLDDRAQLALTAVTAAVVALAGWLTWGEQAAGIYRRLPDGGQLLLTATAAAVFYVTPSFFAYVAALALLFLLIYFRPAWGLALIALTIPFYVNSGSSFVPALLQPKPIFNYRFSPVEIYTLLTLAAFGVSHFMFYVSRVKSQVLRDIHPSSPLHFHPADTAVITFTAVATLSLFFTARLDVATNEWRVVIVEPALFYLLLRGIRPTEREMWVVLDAFILGGLIVALFGLWQYAFARDTLITAEASLMRLRSIYGSPNNVALYLGRILPLLVAMALLGKENGRRRWLYAAAALPIGLAILLSFSKGALFLGLPAALLFVFWMWQRGNGRKTWPWVIGLGLAGIAFLFLAQQIPQLAGRFDLRGATGVFRLNLWRASLNMIADHPLLGVGLDNFLYAYRGRYIFDAAWKEPDLNHPHNIVLDFATRLGLMGLLAGGWLLGSLARALSRLLEQASATWQPVVVGFSGSFAAMLAHGLVDHSFFLVDLAFAFYLMLGTAVWLQTSLHSQSKPAKA